MNTRKSFKRLILLVLLLVIAGGVYAWLRDKNGNTSAYLTDTVSRGEILETVSANGTLNPVILVSVGTQVSGTAVKVYADFNDTVEQGQILLELDPAAYQARERQTRAALDAAQSSFDLAKANAARSKDLFEKGYVARQDLDQAQQALKSARAQVEQARAQVEDAAVDVRNAVIRSPVSGVVVARTVEEGQTVAASFQTPELFKIAGDLKQMLIHTTFAEADIGRIQPGQMARFTVDAFPDRSFRGSVRQVRLNPTTTQNVVTYDVVIDVSNEDLTLLPGMTAYVNVVLSRAKDSLRVPNAALRYRPGGEARSAEGGRPTAAGGRGSRGARGGGGREPTVYVLRAGKAEPEAVKLRSQASDGRYTAVEPVEPGTLVEGDTLVVSDPLAQAAEQRPSPSMRMRF